MKILSRRFLFATVAVMAVSATTIILKYEGDTYIKLIGAIVGVFLASQTITDYKGAKNNE